MSPIGCLLQVIALGLVPFIVSLWKENSTAGAVAVGFVAFLLLRMAGATHRSRANAAEAQRRRDIGWEPPTPMQLEACKRIGFAVDSSTSRAEIADMLAVIAAETRED